MGHINCKTPPLYIDVLVFIMIECVVQIIITHLQSAAKESGRTVKYSKSPIMPHPFPTSPRYINDLVFITIECVLFRIYSLSQKNQAARLIRIWIIWNNIPFRLFQWASVASWFFRPECSLLTTMASGDQVQMSRPSTTRPPIPSVRFSEAPISSVARETSPRSHPNVNPPPQALEQKERTFQAPTICTVIFYLLTWRSYMIF